MGKRKAPLKATPLSIFGELLITAGVILMLYVVWQIYINDPVVGAKQESQAKTYTQTQTSTDQTKQFETISKSLKQGKVFGKIYVPRFGATYQRLIGQGTFQNVTLNKIGVGHYVSSQWPGEVGNFAVAAHRTSHGAPFNKIDTLQGGDLVFVQTNDKWFEYEYRQTKVVDPSDINVISKIPKELNGAHAGGKYMTMTSCHPKWSNQQRIIVWLELVNEYPTSDGMPIKLRNLQNE